MIKSIILLVLTAMVLCQHPEQHTPDLSLSTSFFLDSAQHVVVVKVGSDCYLFQLNFQQQMMTEDPGDLIQLEKDLVNELKINRFYMRVDNGHMHRYSNTIQANCQADNWALRAMA
ncbi:hypothetical protein ACJMK2_025596 [Sinanodonta woodiana]|uniref:Uncharacterized protein n=1 Tax=Sinanodonta woodiana TaxID=1069815 RepID=A0ABD3XHI4_SINWO